MEVDIIEEILNREKQTGLDIVQEMFLKMTKESNELNRFISKKMLADSSSDSIETVSEYVDSLKDMGYIKERYNKDLTITEEGEAKLEEIR